MDSLLILICQARGQQFLVKELHLELQGFRLEVLLFFCSCFEVEEHNLNRD